MSTSLPAEWSPAADALSGRTIMITGASDGIGRALAVACAKLGATVILLGRDQDKLAAAYDEVLALGGAEPAMVPLNLAVARPQDFDQLAAMLQAEFGHLDGLVHCAAILGDITPVEQYEPDTWLQVLQVNLNAPVFLTRALMPLLKAAPAASVVFASSSVGRKGRAFWGAYAVSKAGIESVTQILADEMENVSSIRFNAVNPGGTRTAMRQRAYPAENPRSVKTAGQTLPVFLWLLCDESRAIRGQSLDAPPVTPAG
jgi:NAD(P)-dependent dehydrogenase (short-subunit alcohol dehydrogenase family)